MGLLDIFKKKREIFSKNDPSRCFYCKMPFESFKIQSGFTFGSETRGFGEMILHMQKGCSVCGVPVCFNCAAGEADKRGRSGHCICPTCGTNLDGSS
jgi:hypothetical protein